MIVKCIANNGKDLPKDSLVPKAGFGIDHKYYITIDKYYTIYAMTIFSGYMWYFICDEHNLYYPFWFPSPLFQVEEGSLSKYWLYSFKKGKNKERSKTLIAFPEWINEPYFYDALTDGDKREVKIFKHYKEKMDLEFPNPGIKETVTILDNEWLMCPVCIDAWQSVSEDGMVICPNCKQMKHNPRYVNKAPKKLIL